MITTHSSLLIRLRNRENSDAWSRFVRLYSPLIHHWANKVVRDFNIADDLVQEIFVVLLDNVSTIADNPPDSFRAWLRTVTLNKCRDLLRRNNRKSNPQLVEKIQAAVEDPNLLFSEKEYRQHLAQSALKLMKEHFSETTWRAVWENVVVGRSAQDVAEEFGISANAVYLARGRVMKRLRGELEGLWE